MTNGIGRALWEIYEDAVRELPEENEGGVAGATLKFIEAFEQDLEDAGIELYCKSALKRRTPSRARNRQGRLGIS